MIHDVFPFLRCNGFDAARSSTADVELLVFPLSIAETNPDFRLTKEGLKAKDGVEVPQDIADATSAKYKEAFRMLTGKSLEEVL